MNLHAFVAAWFLSPLLRASFIDGSSGVFVSNRGAIPEPSTILLLGGAGRAALVIRRRVRQARWLLTVGIVAIWSAALFGLRAQDARADLTLAWGLNRDGQLGDGTMIDRNAPAPVNVLTSGVTDVTVGNYHNLAVQNGGVYAWGANYGGKLGDGTTIDRNEPVTVIGLTSGVTQVAAGLYHSLAVQNGGLYAWGANFSGQLGDGATTDRYTPWPVTGLTSGVTGVAAGGLHSLAIQNGGVFAWGQNWYGQVGDGGATERHTPVAVSGLSSGVTKVAGGYYYSLALQNGAVYGWGYNGNSQLGDGATANRYSPVAVSGLTSGVTDVAAGWNHSLAVQNGRVYAWGDNNSGQLGDGTNASRSTPVQIDPIRLNSIVAVASGYYSSYALSSDGSLWLWGSNGYGRLGLGVDTSAYLTPQHLLPPSGYIFTSIEAGDDSHHAVALLAAIPEPSTCLLAAAALGLCFMRRPRARKPD